TREADECVRGAGMRKEWIDVDAGPYGKANAEHLRKRVIEVRRQLVQEGPLWTRGDAGDFERVTVPKRDCDAIRDLLIAERVEKVVEIGFFFVHLSFPLRRGVPLAHT